MGDGVKFFLFYRVMDMRFNGGFWPARIKRSGYQFLFWEILLLKRYKERGKKRNKIVKPGIKVCVCNGLLMPLHCLARDMNQSKKNREKRKDWL